MEDIFEKYMVKFDHIGYVTADLENTALFYKNYLGFEAGDVISPDGMGQKMQYLKKDGVVLEFLAPDAKPAAASCGYKHLAFTALNIDDMFDELKKTGVKMLMKAPIVFDGKKLFFFANEEGAQIEIMERK